LAAAAPGIQARGVHLIRVGDDRVVLKRGLRELLIGGGGAVVLAEQVLPLLDGSRSRPEVVEAFPAPWREQVERLLDALAERGLLADAASDAHDAGGLGRLQDAFYASFPVGAGEAAARLRGAQVVVVGLNLTTRALVRSLLDAGVGQITLVPHPGLDTPTPGDEPPLAADRVVRASHAELAAGVQAASLTTAGSDLGEADALLDVNRLALAAGRPFLPFWISELVGHVGPLVHPFETACLRCYQLRVDANDPRRTVTRAVRRAVAQETNGSLSPGVIPPMAGVVGDVAAMEVLKLLGQFVPSDAVARAIEINLVSFSSTVRRVLKLPRCPDCSEAMDSAALAVRIGPQIAAVGAWGG
jgi:bacteriocin biosynthesis cyclodehydratase domain-containing protein